jgi:hypothetical protein
MSEILNEFIIQQTEALFTVESTNLTVNPEAIQLNIYTGSAPIAGGSNTNVQFNEDGVLQGSNSFTFNNVSEIVTIGNLAISNVANLGGTSNVKIAGGTNGYVLQTDGTGNLSWTAQAGNVTGNGTPGGSNTQIQYNNSGNFGGSAGFTFDSGSNVVNVPGNLIAAGDITAPNFLGNATNANFASYAGYVVNGNQSNITALGLLSNLSVAGTIAGNVITTTGDITSNANIITANGNFIGNLFGTANLAVTVTANAQPNITSVGTLTGLSTSGDINALAGTVFANAINANFFVGNTAFTNISATGNVTANGNISGSQLISNISTGNAPLIVNSTTLVANLNSATANLANFVTQSAQSNITSLGNLTELRVDGTTSIQQAIEKITINGTGSTGTINYDLLTQAIILKSSAASSDFTLNFRGNSSVALSNVVSNGQSITCTFLNTNGSTAYIPNVIQVDGSNVVPYWTANSPTGTTNAIDSYTFNIIRSSGSWVVFGSQTGFA